MSSVSRSHRTGPSKALPEAPEPAILGARGIVIGIVGLLMVTGALVYFLASSPEDLAGGPQAAGAPCQAPYQEAWQWSLGDPTPGRGEHVFRLTADYGPSCRDGKRLVLSADAGSLPVPDGPTGATAFLADPVVLVTLTADGPWQEEAPEGERVVLWELAPGGGSFVPIGTGTSLASVAVPVGACDELATHQVRATLTEGRATVAQETFDLIVDHRCE